MIDYMSDDMPDNYIYMIYIPIHYSCMIQYVCVYMYIYMYICMYMYVCIYIYTMLYDRSHDSNFPTTLDPHGTGVYYYIYIYIYI